MEKEIKATRFEIEQQLNPVVGLINPFGLDKNDKFALFDLKIELSKIMDNIYDFRERTANSIDKPDNFEDIRKQAHSSDATEEVKEEWKKCYKTIMRSLLVLLLIFIIPLNLFLSILFLRKVFRS